MHSPIHILSVVTPKSRQYHNHSLLILHQFCVKLGKCVTETLEMLHDAFGKHSLSRTVVFEWHLRFKAGGMSLEDDERSERQSTSKTTENVENVR
jgi:hypothetical protein